MAPKCPLLYTVTTPTPTVRAFSIARRIAFGPTMIPSRRSASITAVRLDTAQVRHRQHVGALRGVLRGQAELLEDLRHRPSQCRFGDEDLVFRGNLEAL